MLFSDSIASSCKYDPKLFFKIKFLFKSFKNENFTVSVRSSQKYLHRATSEATRYASEYGEVSFYGMEYYRINNPEEINEIIKRETLKYGREN